VSRFSGFSERKNYEQRAYRDYYSARNTADLNTYDQSSIFVNIQKPQDTPNEQNKIFADKDSKERDNERE